MQIRWVLAAAVAFSWGCTCEGKPPTKSLPTPDPVEASDPAPAEEAPQRPARRRAKRERDGFVKVSLGEATLDFRTLPPETNLVALTGSPPMVVVDAYHSEGSKQRLQVRLQGMKFAETVGHAVTRRPGDMQFAAAVVYVDGEGKTFVGKVGRGFEIELGTVNEGTQTVEGKFSGTLAEHKGEGVVEVKDGGFRTSLAAAAPSAGDAPP